MLCALTCCYGVLSPPPPFKTHGTDVQQESEEFNKETPRVVWKSVGGRPADSNRLELPPAIKRNVPINPEKRPRTRATKFIVRVEKAT